MERGLGHRGRGRDGAGGGGRGGRGRGRDGGRGRGGGRHHHQPQQWSPRQDGSGEGWSNSGRGGGGGGSDGYGRGGGQGRGGRGGGSNGYGRGGGPGRGGRGGGGDDASGYGSGGGASTGGLGGDYGRGGGASTGQRVESAPPVQRQPQISRPEPVPEASDRIIPVKRPDNGGTVNIRTARLCVNHFPVRFNPENVIMHYDVDVKPEVSFNKGRPVEISKSTLSLIRNKLSSDDPSRFPLSMTAYDGEKNIFSAVSLPIGNFRVEVSNGEDMKGRSYIVTIKLVNELKLCKLKDYLSGHLMSVPRDILQAMDLVMKENPARHTISVGRSFFPRESREGDDLGRGIAASRGFQPRLKATSQGPAMCLDYSVLAFRKQMPVIDFLRQHINGFDINYFQSFRREVNDVLKGLKVTVTHRKSKQKYTIGGLTDEKTRQISFIAEDPEGKNPPRQLGIVDYFRDKYDKDIIYKDIPCLDLGKGDKKNHVPMEFCNLVEGQRYPKEHLDRNANMKLKNLSVVRPEVREHEICSIVRSEHGPCGGGIIHNFGIEVNPDMTIVTGRRIDPPVLKLVAPNGRVIKVKVDEEKCQWNLVGKSVVEGKRIYRWGVIDFSSSERSSLRPTFFIPKLISKCKNLGIHMEEPLLYERTSMSVFSMVEKLRELLERVNEEGGGNLQILLCVMSMKVDGYKSLKWISETQLGIVTQCCLSTCANLAKDQFLANLAIKINAKLGGSNVELNDPLPHFGGKAHVMFIGADVNHPGSWNTTCPSIAAVVATMNWPAVNRYATRVRTQAHRKERILQFGDMCLELVQSYARLNNVRPDKIVVFRDGVSDNQFDMVLNEELLDLKRAFQTINYYPTITLIVAQKRHPTRFFPESTKDGGSTGNASPGTVVDSIIAHPFEFDFYLFSHYGSIGTSKPTHYHVLWDEHGFSSDLLQKLIYDLCFTFARCTKPVSLVPPVYYADLVAYRGRLYYEAMMKEGQSPASTAPSSSFDQNFFKLHPGLENEMFFV